MTMLGEGCFIGWYVLQPGHDASHDHWHTHEHMIERVAIPGFRRGARYRNLVGTPRVCIIYQVETVGTLSSPAYLERLNNPTPWTSRSLPNFGGMNRTLCQVAETFGHGVGGFLLSMQVSPRPEAARGLRGWLAGEALPSLAARAGLNGAHLLIAGLATRGIPGGILIGIIVIALLGVPLGLTQFKGAVAAPPSLAPTLLQLDIAGALRLGVLTVVLTSFLVDVLDNAGILIATMQRTGLTALVVAGLFLLTLFFAPLATAIPAFATAPALVFVACSMAGAARGIDWDDMTEYLPASVLALTMPFTFSITDGIGLGFITYALVKMAAGQARRVPGAV